MSTAPGEDRAQPTYDSLRALYHETWEEISRLRDYEWKVTYYFVTLSGALIVFFLTDNARPLLGPHLRCVLTFVILLSLGLGIFYLEVTHRYLTQQRNIRRDLEDVLGLYEPLLARPPVLPAQWKGVRITSWFQRLGLVVPLMITMVVSHALCLFVLWSVG